MTDKQVENRLKALAGIDAQIKELTERRDAERNKLIAELKERGTEEITTAHGSVKYALIIGHRFDSDSFKRDHEELYEAFKTLSVSNRFTYRYSV